LASSDDNAIARSEELLRGILEMATDGIFVVQDEVVVLSNETFANMLGYKPDEIYEEFIEDLLDPLEKRYHPERLEAFIGEKEGRETFHTRFQKKDRSLIDVEVSTNSFEFKGEPSVVSIVRDVSEKMSLESAASVSETRFRALFDSSPIAYFTLDPNGIIQEVNTSAEKLLGYESKEMIGANIGTFMPTEEDCLGKQALIEILRGKTLKGAEIEMETAVGQRIWVGITASSLSSDSSRPSEIGFMAENINAKKIAEEKERSARERADLYLEVMTYGMNEVNQDATHTLQLIETMTQLSDDLQADVTESLQGFRRVGRMIANMRVILLLRGSPPKKEKTDVFAHFKRAVMQTKRDLPWKKLEVNSNIQDDQFMVYGHAFLWSAFFNIVHNALLYDQHEEVILEVLASVDELGQEVSIKFIDRGPGIPDEMKEWIFRRKGAVTPEGGVRGIGLTLVDEIVTGLGGRVWVEDRVLGDRSKGSKFFIILPAWREELDLPEITFYKSSHCVFCGPVLDALIEILDELGIDRSLVNVIVVDDPDSEVTEDDLPALPTIHIGTDTLTGLVSDDDLRSSVMNLMLSG
jgi:PAS domain S-box-containing protein